MRRMPRLAGAFAVAFGAAAFSAGAAAAEIVLEHSAVDKLVASALFANAGRLILQQGACFAYLDSPSVALSQGRIRIRSRLVARIGADTGGSCLGVNLSSWTWVSGRPTAVGGVVRLEDLRVDSVDDAALSGVLDGSLRPVFPHALELDVGRAVRDMLHNSASPLQATVQTLQIDSVSADDDRLTIRFEFTLIAR